MPAHRVPRSTQFSCPCRGERPPSVPHFQDSLPNLRAYLKVGPADGGCLAHSFPCWKDMRRWQRDLIPLTNEEKKPLGKKLFCGLSFPLFNMIAREEHVEQKAPGRPEPGDGPVQGSWQTEVHLPTPTPTPTAGHSSVMALVSSELRCSLRVLLCNTVVPAPTAHQIGRAHV